MIQKASNGAPREKLNKWWNRNEDNPWKSDPVASSESFNLAETYDTIIRKIEEELIKLEN